MRPLPVALIMLMLLVGLFSGCGEPENPNVVITVWVPGPVNLGLLPHDDVHILKREDMYIKFRTTDGRIIEHSGQYQIQTRPRP